MTERNPLMANRVRKIAGSFAFIEHRFLRDQFWQNLTHDELLLYFFLVLAADRQGISFYGFDKICSILGISVDHFLTARDGLIEKDLLAFDGRMFQVLSLPEAPVSTESKPLRPGSEMADQDPATIHQLIVHSLGVECD
jgi:hypothetical protein